MVESLAKTCDFHGWATKANIKCADGRIIMKDAFKHNDGLKVPLCWNHNHDDVNDVLGHAILENCDEGVYAYCFFNDTESGQTGKVVVEHKDITALSIYANRLKQNGSNVMHGEIREVSLVHAGANPGACIIETSIRHSDDDEFEARIFTGEEFTLVHADEKAEEDKKTEETKSKKSPIQVYKEMTPEQQEAVQALVSYALESGGEVKHSDDSDKTIGEIYDEMTPEQQAVVAAYVSYALESGEKMGHSDEDDDALEHSADTNTENTNNESEGGNETMKVNVFDKESQKRDDVLTHSEMESILKDGRKYGSLKESALEHGIDKIDYLFPEDHNLNPTPEFIDRDQTWVADVMGGVHHTPYSRIKSQFADITADEARARGYITGNYKKEEIFTLLKRSTSPTTVYKKQKLDRDDIVDITDFDVVAWIKREMRGKLDEELARAYLIGDGRLADSDDKIKEDCIRPIWTDDEKLFTVPVKVTHDNTEEGRAKAFIKACIKNRKKYKGSGNPTLYTTEDLLTEMLLLTDETGRDLYEDEAKLCKKLRVKKIVTVPVMEGANREVNGTKLGLLGIIVNLADYTVGADKGGAVNMFDDFDIDYNAEKYLIETRCSGALTKPFSAMIMEEELA